MLINLILRYQENVSPVVHRFFPGGCKFVPSCSQYLIEAIEMHGVVVGLFYGIKRLLRCWPFVKGGFDPVPEKN